YSRGWGHITTRQNIQFHFVQLNDIPDVMEHLASVGLTSREACGDTVRNIQGCPLPGACPREVPNITQWAEAAVQHFVRNPLGQRLPRKFKINFSGCATDCGQAMFNDVGVVATTRTLEDGSVQAGFQVFIAGGLGANPPPALALEDFTPREELLATIEAVLRVFNNHGNRDNKLRARMKWLVDTMGWEELQDRVIKERRLLLGSWGGPGGVPDEVVKAGDAAAGVAAGVVPTPMGHGTPVQITRRTSGFESWEDSNVVRGAAKGTVSAIAYARLGDVTSEQFRALAAIQRELGLEVRLTNRQNVALRGLREDQLPALYERLEAMGMSQPRAGPAPHRAPPPRARRSDPPGARRARAAAPAPGAAPGTLAVPQGGGLGAAIGARLEEEGLAEVGG